MTRTPGRTSRRLTLLLAAAAAALIHGGSPPEAEACGGFFCNQPNGPNDLPVAQTAENVLFAMERAPSGQFQLEAHVQIFYTGPADRFSWVVPVDTQPTLGVGSNAVFSALLGATQPRFQLEWREVGTCRTSAAPPPAAQASPAPAPAPAAPSGAGGPGVSVAFRGDVGPYDAAVIKSTNRTDPRPLIDWLNENKYFVTPEATRLIEGYVREDKYFVAIRLLNEKGVNEIQPLVMRFLGPGPCVPLKLTSIAAIRDLRVNLWVLADGRVVPDNYFEMEINPARINWFSNGSNYEELVKAAADQAGGNAFVTEFAGPAAILKNQLFQPGRYNVSSIAQAQSPPDALDAIGGMGFPRDSLLLGILRNHIPVPATLMAMGIDERTFYNQLRFYWMQYASQFKPFDARALATELEEKMVKPLQSAQALFDKHAKLTRLATFISPEEMTSDPTFVVNPTLPDVPVLRQAIATRVCGDRQYDRCTAPVRLETPGGTEAVWFLPKPQPVCWGEAFDYERANLDSMPALYRAWARTSIGEGVKRVDMESAIRGAIRTHNAAASRTMREPIPPAVGTPGNPTGTGDPGETAGNARPLTPPGGTGCSCRTEGPAQHSALAWPLTLALALLLIRRRRR